MTRQTRGSRVHERWAHLRFSVIGQLLAAPPAKGELKARRSSTGLGYHPSQLRTGPRSIFVVPSPAGAAPPQYQPRS
jgi:hypothetical protein